MHKSERSLFTRDMKDNQFDKILQDFDTNAQRVAQESAQKQSEDASLLEKFTAHAKSQIEPALSTIGLKVQQYGHDHKVRFDDSKHSMAFEFFPKNIPISEFRRENTPILTFEWNARQRKVSLYSSNISPRRGGEGGPRGLFDLSAVTPEFVRERAMKLVEEVLSKQK